MKLVFDGSSLEKQLTGIGYNLLGLIQGLPAGEHDYVLVVREELTHPVPDFIEVVVTPPVSKWRGGGVWWYLKLGMLARRHRATATIFNTLNVGPLFSPAPIAIIHDLAPLTNPQTSNWRFRLRYKITLGITLLRAQGLVTVSERTRAALQDMFPRRIKTKPIEVLPNGLNAWVFAAPPVKMPTVLKIKKIKQPFLLSVGTIQPRKNYANAIKAFAKFSAMYPNWQYVIAGKWGWDYQEVIDVRDQYPALKGKLIFTNHLPEDALAWVYAHAHGLMLVSTEEGYGMPVLEAYAKGLPMLLSDIAVFQEVTPADASAIFVPADDVAEMTAGLRQLATINHYDPQPDKLARHSWDKIAVKLINFISGVATK